MAIQKFNDWLNGFRVSRGRRALEQLARVTSLAKTSYVSLQNAVLISCYGAAMYSPGADPARALREKRAAISSILESQRGKAKEIRSFLLTKGVLPELTKFWGYIHLRDADSSRANHPKNLKDVAALIDGALSAYEAGLTGALGYLSKTAGLDRHLHGCLAYPEPLDTGKKNHLMKASTMLFFDLVQLFRLHSIGVWPREPFQPMPEAGKSDFSLATALTSAVFPNERLSAAALQTRLRALRKACPGILYYRWPDFPAELAEGQSELLGGAPNRSG